MHGSLALFLLLLFLYFARMSGVSTRTVGCIIGGCVLLGGLFFLLRSRCPHCGRFLAGKLLEIDREDGMEMTSQGYQYKVHTTRRYRCRYCGKRFDR